jgi:lysozyme
MVLTFLSGGLLLYVLSRIFRKKEKQTQNQNEEIPITFSPTPVKSEPTYEEYFNWIRLKEGPPSYRAVPDGKKKDGTQLYSIGIGHQIQPGEEYLFNATISEQKVRELFKADIEQIVKDVNSVVKVPLTRNQKLALVSIRYNVGPGGFRSGKLLSTLNTGNYAGAAAIIPTFITTSNGGIFNLGLANRRKTEQALFIKAN